MEDAKKSAKPGRKDIKGKLNPKLPHKSLQHEDGGQKKKAKQTRQNQKSVPPDQPESIELKPYKRKVSSN